MDARIELLKASFDAAVAAADPARMLAAHLPAPPQRALVVGAGKAGASMAAAVEQAWPKVDLDGIVITRYAHGWPTRAVRVVEAGHPVPDAAGEAAARDILDRVQKMRAGDLLLALVSGGGSSLLSLPVPEVPMEDLKRVTRELLASGAPIEQMNVVRKHLSQIAGGRLADAAVRRDARVLALIVSDVTGDAPTDIASGPCTPDPSTYADALAILQRWSVTPPATVADWLARGARGEVPETPKPGDLRFAAVENRVIATAHGSLEAAADVFKHASIAPVILGDTVTGEAREVAKVYAALVREVRMHAAPFAAPVALISGGECTVTLPAGSSGRGGRCSEFLLSLAVELEGVSGIYAFAADTDGIDGSEDNAGAWLAPDTVSRAAAAGVRARAALDTHDAYGFFAAAGSLLVTGPTRTNVNDYRVILVT
ncbi:MAG TPA: glycerate kinase [Burkholderiaceae bacterium]|nr:glycerate kinase [Burkholderiaceae bacterium]